MPGVGAIRLSEGASEKPHSIESGPEAIVLDVEGTITPASFAYEVLFPYVRSHVRGYLREHATELREAVALLRDEWRSDVAAGEPVLDLVPRGAASGDDPTVWSMYLMWLTYRGRTTRGLRIIQGRILQMGYREGTLHGDVYSDVPRALERWRAAGRIVAVYSSGSILSQQLLFSHSTAGDLTPLIDCYFDAAVGSMRSAESYRAIASKLHRAPADILCVSDVPKELDAARSAGLATLLCERQPMVRDESIIVQHSIIRSFDEISV